jgi:hypothetical protein
MQAAMSNPYPIAPTIIPFPLFDAPAPTPAPLTHCQLATCVAVWSELASVASTGSIFERYCKIETFIASSSLQATHTHNQAFGAICGVKSNILSITMLTSYIDPPLICLFPFPLISSFRGSFSQRRWSYGSRQLAVAGRSLDIVKPNPIHGLLLVLV